MQKEKNKISWFSLNELSNLALVIYSNVNEEHLLMKS